MDWSSIVDIIGWCFTWIFILIVFGVYLYMLLND